MATSDVAEERHLDKIELSKTLDFNKGSKGKLKAYGNIRDICFAVKATHLGSRRVSLEVLFEGDNRKRTLRAKWSIKVENSVFNFEGYLPDIKKPFWSIEVPTENSSTKNFTFTATIFSDFLQLGSGATTGLDQGYDTTAFQADFETGAGSDVTLIASGQDLAAHKFLLSARSRVFRAMFAATGMQEQQTQRVAISDVEPEVLEEVLRYIYTNRVLNADKLALGLLYAADKYDLQGLKDVSEVELCLALTKDNALDLLVAAHLVGCGLLKRTATRFVRTNAQEICASQKWKEISNKYPALGADMFILSVNEMKEERIEWEME